jgi:hypothetical protein
MVRRPKSHRSMMHDDPDSTEPESVDFTYYGKVTPSGLDRHSRDIDKPHMWTITDDTARALSEKTTHAA